MVAIADMEHLRVSIDPSNVFAALFNVGIAMYCLRHGGFSSDCLQGFRRVHDGKQIQHLIFDFGLGSRSTRSGT